MIWVYISVGFVVAVVVLVAAVSIVGSILDRSRR